MHVYIPVSFTISDVMFVPLAVLVTMVIGQIKCAEVVYCLPTLDHRFEELAYARSGGVGVSITHGHGYLYDLVVCSEFSLFLHIWNHVECQVSALISMLNMMVWVRVDFILSCRVGIFVMLCEVLTCLPLAMSPDTRISCLNGVE